MDLPYLDVTQIGSRDYRDVYGTWNAKSEIHESGAVLVCPDGYMAWRYQDSTNKAFDYEKYVKGGIEAGSIGYLIYKATLMVAFLKLMIKNPAASNCPQRTIFVVLQ